MEDRRSGLRVSKVAGLVVLAALAWVPTGRNDLAAQDEPLITPLVETGAEFRYLKGIEEPDPEWMKPEFNDADWDTGPSPFGYGDGPGEPGATGAGTLLDDMAGNYMSVYIRGYFDVKLEPGELLKLTLAFDDGVVVYLNGEEIVRRNLTGTPPAYNTAATSHEVTDAPIDVLLTCEQMTLLQDVDNVLAIQTNNTDLGSSDLVVDPQLSIVTLDSLCPTIRDCEVRTNGSIRVRWTHPLTTIGYDTIELRRNGVLLEDQPSRPTSKTYTDSVPLPGKNTYEIKVTCGAFECTFGCTVDLGGGEGPVFRRGDVDDNASVNLNDAIVILNSLFKGAGNPACLDAADTNDDGAFNLSDGIFLLGSLFQGKDQPPDPGVETCGADPSEDQLGDCVYGGACE